MVRIQSSNLASLYLSDETAWLESMAELIRLGHLDALDFDNLQEYLDAMARRDRREVESRLAVLLTHVLKWLFQPEYRSGSCQATMITQRQELNTLLESAVLRQHAEAKFADAYAKSVERTVSRDWFGNRGTSDGMPSDAGCIAGR